MKQTIKMFELAEDNRSLIFYPTADGVKYLESISKLEKCSLSVAGKMVNAFRITFPTPATYVKVEFLNFTNNIHFHIYLGEPYEVIPLDLVIKIP